MKMLKHKRIFALLCVLVLFGNMLPAFAQAQPAVSVSSGTAAPGEQMTLTVSFSDFTSVTALGLLLSYDPAIFTLESASRCGLMSVETLNTNTAGFVQYSGISDDGTSGGGPLFRVTFRVNASAAEGSYTLPVLVSDAKALVDGVDTDITLGTAAGKVKVEKSTVSSTLYFELTTSGFHVSGGSDVQIRLYCYDTKDLAAGQFSFTYDSNLFEYKTLKLMNTMTQAEYISSINASNPGQVVLAYTSDEPIASGQLVELTLMAKDAASGESEIHFTPLSLYDAEGAALQYSSNDPAKVTITPKAPEAVYPKVWMCAESALLAGETFVVDLYVEGSSGLAAADFTVAYNTSELVCENVSTAQGDDGEDITVIINDSYSDGKIHFSMLYSPGIREDTKLVTIKFRSLGKLAYNTVLSAEVSEPRDANVKPVVLQCESLELRFAQPALMIDRVTDDYAELTLANAAEGRCYVAVYSSAGQMISLGFAEVSANAGRIRVDLKNHAVTEGNRVKAFLVDANGLPVYSCQGV